MFTSDDKGLLAFGKNGQELGYAVKAGLSPLEAIQAATANGPLTIGPQAPLSGQIKEGYDADIIAVTENPLEDVAVLASGQNISHIWKQGTLIKSP